MKNPILVSVVVLVGALAVAPSVLATPITIASTFGPGNTTLPVPVFGIGGNFQNEWSDSFTPSAAYTLDSITVSVLFIGGTSNQMTVTLYSGSSMPGATVESFNLTNLPSVFPGTIETVTSVLHPTLFAGMTYWVGVSAANSSDTFGGWARGVVAYPGEMTLAQDIFYPSWSLGAPNYIPPGGAFSIAGDPIPIPTPEPATWELTLGALGLLGLCLAQKQGVGRRVLTAFNRK